jgi:ppGpp synthetase/RelA/SpoT-type nucleotidyltranferase
MVVAANLDAMRVRYQDMYRTFQLTARELQTEIERLVLSSGIAAANIESRAKDVSSFVKKSIQKGYAMPWEEITDKIGVRITTVHPADVTAVVEALRESDFEIIDIEDKREQLVPAELGYLATHVNARFSERNDLAAADCRFELQVRTAAESAWAYAAHDLMYKAPVEGSLSWQRSTYRLLALVELFDCEIRRLKDEIMTDPTYSEGRVLVALEREFFQMTALEYNRELSRDVIGKLIDLLDIDEQLAPSQAFGNFISANQNKLVGLYEEYLTDHRHVLMSQPESILIFFLLEKDKFSLEEAWKSVLPPSYLVRLSEVWGEPLDLPDEG